MGLIKKLKELFNKNIDCGNEIDDHIVFPLKKKKWLYLNKNIYVKEKNAAVIVYKYKVCDVILEGKCRINQDSIPETYGRAKIERINRKGAKAKRIRADIYYVSLRDFHNFPYESDAPFYVKSGSLGKVKGFLEGSCTLRVLDAGALLRALINETGRAKLEEIPQDISLWIGNKINHIIEKNKIPATQVLSEQEYVESIVCSEMQDALDKIGLLVTNIKLKAVNFPKKYQNKVNSYLSTHQRQVKNFDINANFGTISSPTTKIPIMSEPVSRSQSSAMQNNQKLTNLPTFKECKICKNKNNINAKICNYCGNRLD
ncbi:MAG: SPFH domain-containing protein [Christensenellales bacterium]